jgi:hypothetical protein
VCVCVRDEGCGEGAVQVQVQLALGHRPLYSLQVRGGWVVVVGGGAVGGAVVGIVVGVVVGVVTAAGPPPAPLPPVPGQDM